MQPLGEGEERRAALNNEPANIHPNAALVGDLPGEHLSDSAAVGGGVDVPDGAVFQLGRRVSHGAGKAIPCGVLEERV